MSFSYLKFKELIQDSQGNSLGIFNHYLHPLCRDKGQDPERVIQKEDIMKVTSNLNPTFFLSSQGEIFVILNPHVRLKFERISSS